MPKIACPACEKVYNIPDQAVGQVATCKCGKKFRLGKRKPITAPRVVEASEPTQTEDSFWDDALSEPVVSASVAPVASDHGKTTSRSAAKSSSSAESWKVWADYGFRAAAVMAPFAVWRIAYNTLSESMDEDSLGGPMLYSTVMFLVALVVGVTLAKYGIGFDRGSMKHRLTGLGLMFGGILSAAVGIGVTIALSSATSEAGFFVIGGFGFGLIVFFIGMLQFLSGRNLKSEFSHTRHL
ncbi:zinc ribbon domain-containing protein [Aeoliella mucimassa]|uniref:Uncharacterized protein n=1 Tax=Aeoliella mucimassa TaxID=2527972 RepID=A0A518AUB1_9BACT|nr:hypothetical protein [Aeoliella mucimassa]QDU58303.1 hypothetical protein Pan181_45360 [Aeoliella mucimassa]